jgi:hypothetical protein
MKKMLIISTFLLLHSIQILPQTTEKIRSPKHFDGVISLTNKGISTVPNYTLGKPAAILAISAGGKLRFEPEFRFALEGRPWMFIFWERLDVVKTDKWYTRIGVNYSDYFRPYEIIEAVPGNIIRVSQTMTGDFLENYNMTKNYSVGIYYMYSYGFEKDAIKNMHYLVLRNSFMNIKVAKQLSLRFIPQLYYLRVDNKDGIYFSETLTIFWNNFPLSISSIINQPIKTNIPVNDHFLWNVSLQYSFNNQYIGKE